MCSDSGSNKIGVGGRSVIGRSRTERSDVRYHPFGRLVPFVTAFVPAQRAICGSLRE
jgi:hypothetical protein